MDVLIGNGMTDRYRTALSKYDIVCTNASLTPVLPISTCLRMKQAVPRCEKMFRESCVEKFDAMACEAANAFCENELALPYFASGQHFRELLRVYFFISV